MSSLPAGWRRFRQHLHTEIWRPRDSRGFSPRALLYGTLRVLAITCTVFNETKAASRAAALSFSSLLGLGPLVALTVLVAGLVLDTKDPNLAATTVSRLINFVAPQVGQYSRPADRSARNDSDDAPKAVSGDIAFPTATPPLPTTTTVDTSDPQLNPRLVRMVDHFIAQGRSGRAGTFGIFSLIVIVLLLFKTVEDTFNDIWGVRSGRSLLMRIIYYWAILTFGALLFFASVTLLSAGAFIGVFHETIARLPFSAQVNGVLRWSLPIFSFALLVALLTGFYRIIPHTRVYWRAALTGAVAVASLLMLNNYLAFLYVRRVIITESLYGSLGFPLVMMFGLYIFWLYVLIGSQISYAVQNVHLRNSQAAWAHLSQTTRERLLLAVLLTICRRFHAGLPPLSASRLRPLLRVPAQILNECLNRLVDLKLVIPISSAHEAATADPPYQPAQPLDQLTLRDFKRREDAFGEDPIGDSFTHHDPLLQRYVAASDRLTNEDLFTQNLAQLLAEHPSDTEPPLAGRSDIPPPA